MCESLFANGLGLVVLVVVARYLGPEQYGHYSYVFSLAAIFTMVGHMGLDGLLIRELVQRQGSHGEILGTILATKAIGYALAIAALLVYAFTVSRHTPEERLLFIAASMAAVFSPLSSVLANWFRARLEAVYSSKANIVGTAVSGGVKILIVLLGGSVAAVGFAQAASVIVAVVIMGHYFSLRAGPELSTWRFNLAKARALMSEGWMIFLGSLFAVVYLKIDQVMLRWMVGSESVGVYAVAAKLSEAAYFVPAAVVTTLLPRLIELRARDPSRYQDRFQALLEILALLAYLFLAAMLLFGPLIIEATLDSPYQSASHILLIHVLAFPFVFLRFAFSRWIVIEQLARFSILTQGFGAGLNVALNLLLIPKLGGVGAAIATVASYAAASYLVLAASPRTRPVFRMMTRALAMPWRGITHGMSPGSL